MNNATTRRDRLTGTLRAAAVLPAESAAVAIAATFKLAAYRVRKPNCPNWCMNVLTDVFR